ncbi:MAG: hypothetical protein Q4F38_08245 [Akkermansia sp.]|nr:hypothetical protein [Akkermansia sp.]
MICFSLFRVPVSIHPSLWVMLVLLSSLFTGLAAGIMGAALFGLALFFCLLTHEMGHALVGRMLGGGTPYVYLAWLGGDCCNESARLTRLQGVLMTAAGPLASMLLPLVLVWPAVAVAVGSAGEALSITGGFVLGYVPADLHAVSPPMLLLFGVYLVRICVWWSLLNLLPVYPLDGGQIMHGLMRSSLSMHRISLSFAATLAFFFMALGSWWMVFIMASLALLNYRCMKNE